MLIMNRKVFSEQYQYYNPIRFRKEDGGREEGWEVPVRISTIDNFLDIQYPLNVILRFLLLLIFNGEQESRKCCLNNFLHFIKKSFKQVLILLLEVY